MAYILEPEVAGGWGAGTIADITVHPPVVSELFYEFEGWLGDEILEAFPCFIVSSRIASLLEAHALSGFSLAPVETERSAQFIESHPGTLLPAFLWLKVHGAIGLDDFALDSEHRLVISEAALNAIGRSSIANAEIHAIQGRSKNDL